MSFELSLREGKILVELARTAVEQKLKYGKTIKPPENIPEKLLQLCGVFVTIKSIKGEEKELRGCIGYPYPATSLVQAVIESAVSSATQDSRFYPLSVEELDKIVFEISILTPPHLIEVKKANEYPTKIKVGQDGLIIERNIFKGLLLPQVPIEWGWDSEEFLCQCCIKAGLPPDNWLLKDTKIYKFQAIIFEEEKPKGKVEQKTLG